MTLLMPRAVDAVASVSAAKLQQTVTALKQAQSPPQLVIDGQFVDLPPEVSDVITDLIGRFADGDGVLVGSIGAMLTTSQAADLLGISRTYVVRLIDAGKIPVEYRGTHRRIRVKDVVAYLDSSRRDRAEKLTALAHLSDRTGQYDGDRF